MKRPSTRTVVVSSVSFATGFITAVVLAGGLVFWFGRLSLQGYQGSIVDKLVTTNQLLDSAGRPEGLASEVLHDAQERSIIAATKFDTLNGRYQSMVLRQFARMDSNPVLRGDDSAQGNTAKLARAMVLCTHHAAFPALVDVTQKVRITAFVPTWVVNPIPHAIQPSSNDTNGVLQDPRVTAAKAKKWQTLHAWVMRHQDCGAVRALS